MKEIRDVKEAFSTCLEESSFSVEEILQLVVNFTGGSKEIKYHEEEMECEPT